MDPKKVLMSDKNDFLYSSSPPEDPSLLPPKLPKVPPKTDPVPLLAANYALILMASI